ncbi:DNA-processing protein DprA [Thiorhodovibrio frisius]|uniref:Putative Rossmann fold nucleotide-binding protein involved in DNA uptake n=1 Tax=Thiorhodovibrio frisius TaxID=631362 RepID=H8Z2G9_9GAMM|nr:DNA-processing protein DprA [Thiorhodovibrio frisius]EIC21624.1 putative Rossmann fold nucleotide-binding protein involved in DNA uptake [Thiorhodovibrio frisius]WPL21590.1 DNA protecting protein DprA [Thiorhodovibrio frisius]
MTVSANTQAILLLTTHFNKTESALIKPLSPREWGRFADWLWQQSLTPEHLLRGDLHNLLAEWHDKAVSIERVGALLDRGSALAISMEKWLRSGLWVMTRSDPDYPRRLKQRLRGDSPAVLFGCGNRNLLNGGGLAVVGSRKVKDADLAYSSKLGALASEAGVSIVSGGARGVDETTMLGALTVEGTAVGVLADSLLRACTSVKYREYLLNNSLALVSPFNPEAGFNVGNAMQRNKYIYCLADAALAVHSGKTGGTWNGAQEDLNKGWIPLWVKPTHDPEAGNAALIAAGASTAPASIDEVNVVAFFGAGEKPPKADLQLFEQVSMAVEASSPPQGPNAEAVPGSEVQKKSTRVVDDKEKSSVPEEIGSRGVPQVADLSKITFYELFVAKVKSLCADQPRTAEEMVDALAISKTQANAWLKQAVQNGELKKLAKPVRYEVDGSKQGVFALE